MSSTIQTFINNNFGGIRRKSSQFSPEQITCSDCQNVELYFTELNSGVGLRTTKGNICISTYVNAEEQTIKLIPEGEEVIGIFNSMQDGESCFIVYTESDEEGKIYNLNIEAKSITLLVDNLTVTGKACGTDFVQGWLDMFVFTNGVEVKYIYSDTETHDRLLVESDSFEDEKLYTISENEATEVSSDAEAHSGKLTATVSGSTVTLYRKSGLDTKLSNTNYYGWSDGVNNYYTTVGMNVIMYDTEGREVSGLGLCIFDNRIWIFNGRALWYSKQSECRDFSYNDTDIVTSAGYIEFVKNITAIYPYLGTLAVFHKDSSSLVAVNNTTKFEVKDESPGGCAGYNSLVFHGTDLYFYDDIKKGVFSFQQIVNGDKTLSNNIAYDIQKELMSINSEDVDKIKTLSVITDDRNEIWFLTPLNDTYKVKVNNETVEKQASIVLIFDYIRGEWVKRKCQKINAINIIDNILYSAGSDIYQEYVSNTFNGDFIASSYQCTVFNMGTDNTLKITKFPPRIALDANAHNDFKVSYIKNYNTLKPLKEKPIKTKSIGNVLIYDTDMTYDAQYIYIPNALSVIAKLPSATFKSLEIKFYTDSQDQSFSIMSFEISKLKVKQI